MKTIEKAAESVQIGDVLCATREGVMAPLGPVMSISECDGDYMFKLDDRHYRRAKAGMPVCVAGGDC